MSGFGCIMPASTAHVLMTSADFTNEEYERGVNGAREGIDGGLGICKICGGAEGSLPTECPGFKMSGEEHDAVYAGNLDFIGGFWHGHLTKAQRNKS